LGKGKEIFGSTKVPGSQIRQHSGDIGIKKVIFGEKPNFTVFFRNRTSTK
jgi:hypothetical protein